MKNSFPKIGAHQSISGGIHKAIIRAKNINTQILQIFTKNSNRWIGKQIEKEDIKKFFELKEKNKIEKIISHAGYLINLASNNEKNIKKSMDCLKQDIENSLLLNIELIVLHPGSHKGTSIKEGIERVARHLDKVIEEFKDESFFILLENTAGQGDSIGFRLSHLLQIKKLMNHKDKIKFCLDTCHLYSAGYNISCESEFKKLKEKIDVKDIIVIHLNDSKRELGSRVDRHEHIGKGKIGLKGFSNFLNDKDFRDKYFIIETPKSGEMDRININVLKKLIK